MQRDRVAASSLALTRAVDKLRGGRVKPARSAAARLTADLRRYRDVLVASKPQASQASAKPAALRAVDRHIAAVRELRRALARYASSRDRTASARTVAKAARKLTEANSATAAASRRLLR